MAVEQVTAPSADTPQPAAAEKRDASPSRVVALLGPRSSGKTQFKVFLAYDESLPSRYLTWLYPIPGRVLESGMQAMWVGGNTPGAPPIIYEGDDCYQQLFDPTRHEAQDIKLRYGDERAGSPQACVRDFPGEFFSSAELGPSVEATYLEKRKERLDSLRPAGTLVVIVPFWHLLPYPLYEEVRQRGALLEAPERYSAMVSDMQDWFGVLDDLALERNVHRHLVVAISQFGGATLSTTRPALANVVSRDPRAKGVASVFDRLDRTTTAVQRLAIRSQTDGKRARAGLRLPCQFARAIASLRALDEVGKSFLAECGAAGNKTAAGLLKYQRAWNSEVISFNVVDGTPVERTRKDDGRKITYFKQELVNVHLVLLKVWQDALENVVW